MPFYFVVPVSFTEASSRSYLAMSGTVARGSGGRRRVCREITFALSLPITSSDLVGAGVQ